MAYTVIQNGYTRYTFETRKSNMGRDMYCIVTEIMGRTMTGSSVTFEFVSRERGNAFYIEMMSKGFHRFRNARDVSWSATLDTYEKRYNKEEWRVDGKYFIPCRGA